MTITTDMKIITDTIFDVIQDMNGNLCPVFASDVADRVEKELLKKMEEQNNGDNIVDSIMHTTNGGMR